VSLVGLIVAIHLSATPITLDEVRSASRQNLDALRAELDAVKAQEEVRVARSAIFPQANLSLNVGGTFAGPMDLTTLCPMDQPRRRWTFADSRSG
jgi:outer membrane protein TolC